MRPLTRVGEGVNVGVGAEVTVGVRAEVSVGVKATRKAARRSRVLLECLEEAELPVLQ